MDSGEKFTFISTYIFLTLIKSNCNFLSFTISDSARAYREIRKYELSTELGNKSRSKFAHPVKFLTCIQEDPISNPNRDIGYPD